MDFKSVKYFFQKLSHFWWWVCEDTNKFYLTSTYITIIKTHSMTVLTSSPGSPGSPFSPLSPGKPWSPWETITSNVKYLMKYQFWTNTLWSGGCTIGCPTSTTGSQLLDGDRSYSGQIMVTQPCDPTWNWEKAGTHQTLSRVPTFEINENIGHVIRPEHLVAQHVET